MVTEPSSRTASSNLCARLVFFATQRLEHQLMNKVTYKVVKHDGDWAYERMVRTSEPFRTREEARTAAKLAASEQATAGE